MFICLAVLDGKDFNIGHFVRAFEPTSFIPAILMDTMDLCHFRPFSVRLTLAEDLINVVLVYIWKKFGRGGGEGAE